jgi:Ca2+-binding RTX toxin-like protein
MTAPVLSAEPGSAPTPGGAPLLTNFAISGLPAGTGLYRASAEVTSTYFSSGDTFRVTANDHISVTLLSDGRYRVFYDGVDVAFESFPTSTSLKLIFSANATEEIAEAVIGAINLIPDPAHVDAGRQCQVSFKLAGAVAADAGYLRYGVGSSLGDNLQGNVLSGLAGDDTLSATAHTIYVTQGTPDTHTYVDGGEGNDTLVLSGVLPVNTSFMPIDLRITTEQYLGHGRYLTINSIENFSQGPHNQGTITGTDAANTLSANVIYALGGDDWLSVGSFVDGGTGVDTVTGRGTLDLGNSSRFVNVENLIGSTFGDILSGTDGDNLLDGGNGNDQLVGRGGNDTLLGGASKDTLTGGDGNDILAGGAADDIIDGGAGIDTADYTGFGGGVTVSLALSGPQNTGPAGTDTITGVENLVGGLWNDSFVGSIGANVIHAGAGSDVVAGLGGADFLFGEDGNDNLQGGAGDDTLVGGLGRDTLTGGNDADTFVFATLADSVVGGQRDVVADFAQGSDHIDLTGIEAQTGQSLAFIGSAPFSGTAGELRFYFASTQTILAGDTNGDGTADFQVALRGTLTLTGGDFIL